MSDSHQFLTALYGGKPDSLYACLWWRDTKRHRFYRNVQAASDAVEGANDAYVCVSLFKDRKRGNALSRALPGLWLDIDMQSESKAPVTPDQVNEFIGALPKPTMITHTPHGMHLWHLFTDLWVFKSLAAQRNAAQLCVAWERMAQETANAIGFEIDFVSDLARVMRVPGTVSGDVPITMQWFGDRYSRTAMRELVKEHWSVSAPQRSTNAKITSKDDCLLDIDPVEYVYVLTGKQPERGSKVTCPFHNDSAPSMHLYPGTKGFTCFGCGRSGGIYQFAGYLWGYLAPPIKGDNGRWQPSLLREKQFLAVQSRLFDEWEAYYERRDAA